MTEHIHCKSQPQPDTFLPGKSPTWWCCALGSLSTLTWQPCRAEPPQEGALFHITHPKGERLAKRRWEIWEKHTKRVLCSDSCGFPTMEKSGSIGTANSCALLPSILWVAFAHKLTSCCYSEDYSSSNMFFCVGQAFWTSDPKAAGCQGQALCFHPL